MDKNAAKMLQGEIINSDAHIRMLTELRKHFKTVWPHKNQREILIQYDNAMLHTSVQAQEAITNFAWAVLPCPQSSNFRFPPIRVQKNVICSTSLRLMMM